MYASAYGGAGTSAPGGRDHRRQECGETCDGRGGYHHQAHSPAPPVAVSHCLLLPLTSHPACGPLVHNSVARLSDTDHCCPRAYVIGGFRETPGDIHPLTAPPPHCTGSGALRLGNARVSVHGATCRFSEPTWVQSRRSMTHHTSSVLHTEWSPVKIARDLDKSMHLRSF